MEDSRVDVAKVSCKTNNAGNEVFSACLQLFAERHITLSTRLFKELKQICGSYASDRAGS
jgi:hypothetical protein